MYIKSDNRLIIMDECRLFIERPELRAFFDEDLYVNGEGCLNDIKTTIKTIYGKIRHIKRIETDFSSVIRNSSVEIRGYKIEIFSSYKLLHTLNRVMPLILRLEEKPEILPIFTKSFNTRFYVSASVLKDLVPILKPADWDWSLISKSSSDKLIVLKKGPVLTLSSPGSISCHVGVYVPTNFKRFSQCLRNSGGRGEKLLTAINKQLLEKY